MRRLALLALLSLVVPSAARAEDYEGCKDLPVMKRYPGTEIYGCDNKEYDEVELPMKVEDKATSSKRVGGHVQIVNYNKPESASDLQVWRNIENALSKAGFKILVGSRAGSDCCDVTGRLKDTVVSATVGGGGYTVTQVDIKEMEQKMDADASAMLDELNKSGHVAVYGINFDTGKASLKPDSEAVLGEVAKLLKDNEDLKLRVEGHTDNQGKAKDNLELSKKRAQAVKDWLVKSGVDKSRLTTDGFGDKKPVGDNKTDEGRAKNRRVELVKL